MLEFSEYCSLTNLKEIKMKNLFFIATAAILLTLSQAMAMDGQGDAKKAEMNTASENAAQTIVDQATSNDQFSTLVTALKQAGYVQALDQNGPYTVLAPTDAAFDKLPEDTLNNLLKPENKDQLRALLAYHVIPSKAMSSDLAGQDQTLQTAHGQSVSVDGTNDGITVNGAKVVKADVSASNGVIHAIDTVLVP
jgi:uncharacterized surface protein with fasciclin (FAS1) repeats